MAAEDDKGGRSPSVRQASGLEQVAVAAQQKGSDAGSHLVLLSSSMALALVLLWGAFSGSAPVAAQTSPPPNNRPDYVGTWGYHASTIDATGRPWYKGNWESTNWSDLEPSNNTYNWQTFDAAVNAAYSRGLYFMPMIAGGHQAPSWLYNNGVPRYHTLFSGASDFPYYLDPEYQTFFKRMLRNVRDHILSYPAEKRNKIVGIQIAVGASGDPHPYKTSGTGGGNGTGGDFGDSPEGTCYGATSCFISRDEWDAYQRDMFLYSYDLYKTTSPVIHPLFNPTPSLVQWVADTMPEAWMKTGRIGDRYQVNGEVPNLLPSLIREFYNGHAIRARSEMDLTDKGWFTEAPVWNMYWTNLWGLHNGQDIHNNVDRDLTNAALYPAFEFYSKYAGFKDPQDSPGVWVALHDGLDASDTARFPEAQFGTASKTNATRYTKIANAMASYGALQNDPQAAGATSYNALNDVGWQIYTGNFQMWLTQINPNGTSQGLWRQGPKTQMYGRFARRFDHASGKDAIYFDIDDRFFGGQALNAGYPVTFRVVYLDQGTGSFALKYDAVGGAQKTAFTVTKTNSGQWKEKTMTVSDGYLFNRISVPSSVATGATADLMLVNTDAENDTFHMIEVTRDFGATPPPDDTTPPETTIDSDPSGTITNTTATFGFSSSETNSHFECKLEPVETAFSSCVSPKSYSGLANGSYTFSVRATDAAGNTDTSPATRSFTVSTTQGGDTTLPTVVSAVPAANATGVAATMNVTATFSEEMMASSINGNTFTLTKKGSSTKITAAVSYPDPNSPPVRRNLTRPTPYGVGLPTRRW
jgi:Bacterial Ig-like domain